MNTLKLFALTAGLTTLVHSYLNDAELQIRGDEQNMSDKELLDYSYQQREALKHASGNHTQEILRLEKLIHYLEQLIDKKHTQEAELENMITVTNLLMGKSRKPRKIRLPINNAKPTKFENDPVYGRGYVFKATAPENVYAPIDGKVASIKKNNQLNYVVVLETSDKHHYILTGLHKVTVKEGAQVQANQVIGHAQPGAHIYLEYYEF